MTLRAGMLLQLSENSWIVSGRRFTGQGNGFTQAAEKVRFWVAQRFTAAVKAFFLIAGFSPRGVALKIFAGS